MLPPDVFDGIGVSDDAAVYQGRFAQAQKCWAHLLRKAIKLTLLFRAQPSGSPLWPRISPASLSREARATRSSPGSLPVNTPYASNWAASER